MPHVIGPVPDPPPRKKAIAHAAQPKPPKVVVAPSGFDPSDIAAVINANVVGGMLYVNSIPAYQAPQFSPQQQVGWLHIFQKGGT